MEIKSNLTQPTFLNATLTINFDLLLNDRSKMSNPKPDPTAKLGFNGAAAGVAFPSINAPPGFESIPKIPESVLYQFMNMSEDVIPPAVQLGARKPQVIKEGWVHKRGKYFGSFCSVYWR